MIDGLGDLPTRAAAHLADTGRPYVTLTYAQSLDGSIAARQGAQLHISGPETKLFTHRLRAAHDAILVGIGTVLADNPKLTARRAGGPHPQPVILDSYARFPLESALFEHPTHKPWIAAANTVNAAQIEALEQAGARVMPLSTSAAGTISLAALLDQLGVEGIRSLMVEGGAQVITNFLRARLVDQVILTIAPIFVGGLRSIDDLGLAHSSHFPRLTEMQIERMGDDLIVWGVPHWQDQ